VFGLLSGIWTVIALALIIFTLAAISSNSR